MRIANLPAFPASRLFAAATLAATLAAQSPFAPGNLVVLRVGDGVNPLSNASQALFLDEFSPTGTLVQIVALPTAAAGANQAITCSGSATSEGNLQLSANGQYLVLAGYTAAPGLTSVASTAAATTPRVIGRVGLDAAIDTSTTIDNLFSGNNIRSATSTDGTEFFAAGATSGIVYATLGTNGGTSLNTANPLNNRTVQIQNGQLYCSGSAQGFYSVSAVGTGVPTTPVQTITALNGLPAASGPSAYDFFFADPTTLYIADDRTTGGNGGIYKYTDVGGGVWQFQYALNANIGAGCRGLTGYVQNGVATLFATNTTTSTNDVLMVVDTGASSTFTTIATAGVNTVFRGIRMVPNGSAVTRIPHGCGPTTIAASGTGAIGTSVVTTLGNTTGLAFVGYGIAVAPQAICAQCTLGHEWSAVLFAATSTFQVPNNATFAGLSIGIQGADVFASGGCTVPAQVTLTDTLVVTIH